MNTALITGAASGIGLALSQLYLKKGYKVIMVDKNQGQLYEETEALEPNYPQQISTYVCDISQEKEVRHVAQQITQNQQEISFIYNNAGIIGTLAPLWQLSTEEVHQVIEVNVYGMLHMIRAFMPKLLEQTQRAHIINMASLYALSSGSQLASYAMSKHAVLALTESLYFDLSHLGHPIDVSVAFPSFTDTGLLSCATKQDSAFHNTLNNLLAHSQSALDLAKEIIQEVEQKCFYIIPDKEVKTYCEERTRALLMQQNPHLNTIEKLIHSLLQRQLNKRGSKHRLCK